MKLIYPASLAKTLDAVNEALFLGRTLNAADRALAARWIAARQGLPGAYADMFAPTNADFGNGIRVFTGERIGTRAGTAHILGEEASRALILLDSSDRTVRETLARAGAGMNARLEDTEARGHRVGAYCCGTCSAAFWRHLAVGGLAHPDRWLGAGMKALKSRRSGDGKWRVFPFWYTLLALSEIELPAAVSEMRHAAPRCEAYLTRWRAGENYAQRRRAVAEQVLARC